MSGQTYKTADIVLAAVLIVSGVKLIAIEPQETKVKSGMYRFVFEDSPERNKLLLEFTSKQVKVEPIGFMESIRSLKQYIKDYTGD